MMMNTKADRFTMFTQSTVAREGKTVEAGSINDNQAETVRKKLLICLYIRSRLFPFSVTAILQITFRNHNPSGEKESAIKKVGKFHQEARSVLLVKSILIIDELSITEYKNVSSTFFCLLYSPVGRCFATYRVFGGEVIKK